MPALSNANIDYDPGPVTTITLNRTERRNAITTPMLSAMLWAIEQASEDATVRVIVKIDIGEAEVAHIRSFRRILYFQFQQILIAMELFV